MVSVARASILYTTVYVYIIYKQIYIYIYIYIWPVIRWVSSVGIDGRATVKVAKCTRHALL